MRVPLLVRCLTALMLILSISGVSASGALASHFRGGQVTWKRVGPTTIDYQVTGSFRRDGYPGTASDGHPAVGDVIEEDIGDTQFSFGDGITTDILHFKVVAIVPGENYLIGRALAPRSLTSTVLEHTYTNGPPPGPGYPGPGTYPTTPSTTPLPSEVTASFDSCCTIESLNNNSGGQYRVQTIVPFSGPTSSPNSSLKPIVNVGTSGVQTFSIPATVPTGTTRRFRLATAAESCDACSNSQPSNLSIDPTIGVVRFDTTGKALGLYFVSVVVEAVGAGGSVVATAQQTFLVNVTAAVDNSNAGFYPSSSDPAEYGVALGGSSPGADGTNAPDGSTFFAPPSQSFRIKVTAADPVHPNAVVHVDNLGLPDGAVFAATDGNPASGLVEWVPQPGQVGDFIVTFTVSETVPTGRSLTRAGSGASGITSRTISYTLRVAPDATAPTVKVVALPSCTTSGELEFVVTDGADGVGAASLVTQLDGGGPVAHAVAADGSVALMVPDEASHTLVLSGRDLNGNQSAAQTKTFRTDRTNPAVSITGTASYVVGQVGVASVTATDAGTLVSDPSGSVALDTSTIGSHTVQKSATDGCGNVGTGSFTYEVKPASPSNLAGDLLSSKVKAPSPGIKAGLPAGKPSKFAAFTLPAAGKCLAKPQLTITISGTSPFKTLNVIVNGHKTVVHVGHKKKLVIKLPKSIKTFNVRLSKLGDQTLNKTYHRCH